MFIKPRATPAEMKEKRIADMSRLEFTESEGEDDDDGNDGFKADSDDEFSNPLAMRNVSSDKTFDV
jgi:hypothetical protein